MRLDRCSSFNVFLAFVVQSQPCHATQSPHVSRASLSHKLCRPSRSLPAAIPLHPSTMRSNPTAPHSAYHLQQSYSRHVPTYSYLYPCHVNHTCAPSLLAVREGIRGIRFFYYCASFLHFHAISLPLLCHCRHWRSLAIRWKRRSAPSLETSSRDSLKAGKEIVGEG